MNEGATVLVVEDDEDDFFFTRRTLRDFAFSRISRVENGRAAIDYLLGRGPYADRATHPVPTLVLLDLKMDHVSGHDVLAAVRTCPPTPLPRIYVLTGSNEPKDLELVRASGVAAGYIVKPITAQHLRSMIAELGS